MNWPAIIVHDGDDELTYIASYAEWKKHVDLSVMEYGPDSQLIDSRGHVFLVDSREDEKANLVPSGQRISLEVLVRLAQRHAAISNACCVEKLGFRSINEGLAIIASLIEE
ncbi:MAG: DUF4144 family protein [Gammaproteobacteria bacterium]|nr:DUF4144 family protein [Gammaproteobacteria bacterium]MDX2487968.1 DUF4144 family protein [Gammaproteobacteria bacterium]